MVTRGRVPCRSLPHTADAAFEVEASDLPRLFEAAAAAMFDLIVDIERIETETVEAHVEVEAEDRETLLVAWLSALLTRAMVQGETYRAFSVDALEPRALRGRAWGEPLDPRRHGFRTEVKAVTYHELAIEEFPGGWRARVLVDI